MHCLPLLISPRGLSRVFFLVGAQNIALHSILLFYKLVHKRMSSSWFYDHTYCQRKNWSMYLPTSFMNTSQIRPTATMKKQIFYSSNQKFISHDKKLIIEERWIIIKLFCIFQYNFALWREKLNLSLEFQNNKLCITRNSKFSIWHLGQFGNTLHNFIFKWGFWNLKEF